MVEGRTKKEMAMALEIFWEKEKISGLSPLLPLQGGGGEKETQIHTFSIPHSPLYSLIPSSYSSSIYLINQTQISICWNKGMNRESDQKLLAVQLLPEASQSYYFLSG